MEMKRVDFLYGVIFLSIVLLLSLLLQVYGYLDAQTYVLVTAKNSFYGFSTEPIPVYTYFRSLLYYMYGYLFIYFFSMWFFYETYDKVPNATLPFVFSVSLHGLFNSMRSKIRLHDGQHFGWYHGSSGVETNRFDHFLNSSVDILFPAVWVPKIHVLETCVVHICNSDPCTDGNIHILCLLQQSCWFFSFCKEEQSRCFDNMVVWWTFIQ